ncbi:MAG: 16S rRNA (cytidine(1402)-2'-O)-methyltransferase [Burkholderiales bacterium]|nr:16S rRNA (cytidine(1402)-2'-O)-methyltransferase [Burkholderiales bacterium]
MQIDERAKAQLYVVATPIGNLRDITLRAIDVLKNVSLIAAEDTRVTSTLLRTYGVSAPMLSLHRHNERQAARQVLAMLAEGKSVALVSDAGTPAISDPGALLVQDARDAGHPVVPIPGPNAAIAALSAAGLPEGGFLFYGFLPARSGARRLAIGKLKPLPYALVFYEAPHRIVELAEDLQKELERDRNVIFAREITKRFESIHACPLATAVDWLRADPDRQRGEFVVIVSAGKPAQDDDAEESKRVLEILLAVFPVSQAAGIAAQITGAKKNRLYELALRLKDET